MNTYQTTLAASLLLVVSACSAAALREDDDEVVQAPARDCVADLDFTAAFLLTNDAGIRGLGWDAYPPRVDEAFQRERASAAMAQSVPECIATLHRFLTAIRKGHIFALSTNIENDALGSDPTYSEKVAIRRLSDQILYIEAPSFGAGIREQLLQLVDENKDVLGRARGLVIDLRRNSGGEDSAFEPLLELLGPATYQAEYPHVLATAANIAAWEAIVPEITHPPTVELAERLIAQMKLVGDGWVPMADVAIRETRVDLSRVKAAPERVVLLIGSECASSCEQFVLMARQNERVTLMGRRTFGALDASNLRQVLAPSGQVSIFYATTFTKRPPGQQIDEIGIAPDIELPLPADEADFAAEVTVAQEAIEAQWVITGP